MGVLGDAAMPQLIHHWYWARAEAGGYCVIASDITAERKYGHLSIRLADQILGVPKFRRGGR
jgi:hypothetical protein